VACCALCAGAEALAPIELEAGADAEASAPVELELCASTLDIGKPMNAASAPAANALPVRVISFFTSLFYYVRREVGGETDVAQIEQHRC